MNKTFSKGFNLYRLIEDAPTDLVAKFTARHAEDHSLPGGLHSLDEEALRAHLLAVAADLGSDRARRLDDDAGRVLKLAGDDGKRDLERAVASRLHPARRELYNAHKDTLGRSLWIFLEEPLLFDDAESLFEASQYRGFGRPYSAFETIEGTADAFAWSDELAEALAARITGDLSLKEMCTVRSLTLREDNKVVHAVIVRHAGPLSSVEEHRRGVSKGRHYFQPPNEATLFYTPEDGVVEVCAESTAVRQDVAVCFAETALAMDLSAKPLTFREYDLSCLQETLRLPQVELEGFAMIRAAVVAVEFRPRHPQRKVTVEVGFEDDIESVATELLRAASPTERGTIVRVQIMARFKRLGGSSGKSVRVILSYPNRSNLRSIADAEKREVGTRLLEAWKLLRHSKALTPSDERALFPKLLDLYELRESRMAENDLASHGFDVSGLISSGFARPHGRYAAVVEDDGGPDLVDVSEGVGGAAEFTGPDGRTAWLPGALVRKIEINRSYIEEKLLWAIKPALRRFHHSVDGDYLRRLGEIDIDGPVQCYLARRLGDVESFCDVERRLSCDEQPGLILTTSQEAPHWLRHKVVARLRDHLEESGENGPSISLAALAATYRQRRARALGGSGVELLQNESGTSTLHLPNRPPLSIMGPKQTLIVRRLVDAHRAGSPDVPTAALVAGTSCTSPSQAFRGRWDGINEVYIAKVGAKSGWRLAV